MVGFAWARIFNVFDDISQEFWIARSRERNTPSGFVDRISEAAVFDG